MQSRSYFFTGDLVNDRADEMKDYMDVFDKLKAPLGVYSTLGNRLIMATILPGRASRQKDNLERLKQVHAELGWRLLMNEHVVLEKMNTKLHCLGSRTGVHLAVSQNMAK